MVYNIVYIILIFGAGAAIGSDFRSGFRRSSQSNSIDTRENELENTDQEGSEREEKSKSTLQNPNS